MNMNKLWTSVSRANILTMNNNVLHLFVIFENYNFFCRGSDVQIIMSVSLVGLILIHTVREALFRTDTYWLQEVYFRAECLPQKLQLSFFMHVQLLPRPGKQMKPTWVTERVVGKKEAKQISWKRKLVKRSCSIFCSTYWVKVCWCFRFTCCLFHVIVFYHWEKR